MGNYREIDLQEGLRASQNELKYFLAEPEEGKLIVVHKQFLRSCIVGWEWDADYLRMEEYNIDYMAVHHLILMHPPKFQPSLVAATILVEKYPPTGYSPGTLIYPDESWVRKRHMGATDTVLTYEAYAKGVQAAKEILGGTSNGNDEVSISG